MTRTEDRLSGCDLSEIAEVTFSFAYFDLQVPKAWNV